MIHDVDEAVRSLIREEALSGTPVEVVFDAPTKEWSSRRNSPTLDVYLYDIRENLRRRENGIYDIHNDEGRITGRRRPPRHFKLSYLVTAWTQRPEDEHRLLSAVLGCFVRHDRLPPDRLQGALAEQGLPIPVTVALPPPEDRALSDVWSALGGELKPSLDLVVTVPVDTLAFEPVATLVTEQPRFTLASADGSVEHRQGRRTAEGEPEAGSAEAESGAKQAGARRGRGKGGKGASGQAEPAGAAEAKSAGSEGAASSGASASERTAAATEAVPETVTAGTEQHPGRIYHWRNLADP